MKHKGLRFESELPPSPPPTEIDRTIAQRGASREDNTKLIREFTMPLYPLWFLVLFMAITLVVGFQLGAWVSE